MKSYVSLPVGYQPSEQLDLLHNRRQLILVTVLNLVITVLMIAGAVLRGHAIHFSSLGMGNFLLKVFLCLAGIALYMVLHELVHGLVIALCGAKPFYGFGGGYAYAGSKSYFSRVAYIGIALAPVILWGIVLALLLPLLPEGWFWVGYLIQVMNIGGAAGDYYVTVRILGMPADTLVQDTGIAMSFFTRTKLPDEPPAEYQH